MSWGQAIATSAAMLGSAYSANESSRKANASNKDFQNRQYWYQLALQRNQQNWLANMANTAHQREVEDLRAAGLNPLLSLNKGADTPSSGMGNIGLPSADAEINAKNNAINAILQNRQLSQQQQSINNLNQVQQQQANLLEQQAESEKVNKLLKIYQTLNQKEEAIKKSKDNSNYEKTYLLKVQKMQAEIGKDIASTAKMQTDMDIEQKDYRLRASAQELDNKRTRIETNILKHNQYKNILEAQEAYEWLEFKKHHPKLGMIDNLLRKRNPLIK